MFDSQKKVELLKNPVLIGFFAGLLTYFYLVWEKKKEIEKAKKSKKNKKVEKKVDLLIPGLVVLVVGFISYLYINKHSDGIYSTHSTHSTHILDAKTNAIDQNLPKTYHLVSDSNSAEEFGNPQLSYTLITNNKGITLPDGLHANMFIEKL
jgi:uncharacterized protein (UPF0333 family)